MVRRVTRFTLQCPDCLSYCVIHDETHIYKCWNCSTVNWCFEDSIGEFAIENNMTEITVISLYEDGLLPYLDSNYE